jgi:uridine phosphorylase
VPQRRVEPIHLKPAAELAERVLLPGDPHRALAVAREILDQPRMFNHARGLWGYTGRARDGGLLTVQSTGMGGPSAAIVVEELVALGARRLVRIGTCGAIDPGLALGELLAAREVLSADGASAALGSGEVLQPDQALTDALVAAGARPATIVSTDLFYDPREEGWASRGAEAVEMEAATLLRVAAVRGARAACLLAVTDVPAPAGMIRIASEELEAAGVRLGELAYEALVAAAGARTVTEPGR